MNASPLTIHVAQASAPPPRGNRVAPHEHVFTLPVVRELPVDMTSALGPALVW